MQVGGGHTGLVCKLVNDNTRPARQRVGTESTVRRHNTMESIMKSEHANIAKTVQNKSHSQLQQSLFEVCKNVNRGEARPDLETFWILATVLCQRAR